MAIGMLDLILRQRKKRVLNAAPLRHVHIFKDRHERFGRDSWYLHANVDTFLNGPFRNVMITMNYVPNLSMTMIIIML